MSKAQPRYRECFCVNLGHGLVDKVFAGNAGMDLAGGDLAGNLAGRQIGNLDPVNTPDVTAVITLATGPLKTQSGTIEKIHDRLLQATFGGYGENQRVAHGASSPRRST